MLEAVRNNKRVAQFILALLIVPFAFFGLDSYFADGPGGGEVATVGSAKISVAEFEQALREQQDRLRQSMGGQIDRSLLDSDMLRRSVVDNLVNQRLLAMHAADSRIVVTPQHLQKVIAEVPAFQADGRFSLERYEAAVRAQGMSPAMFEARLGRDLRVQQIALAVAESGFAAEASARRFLAAQLEERTISELKFAPEAFVGGVKLADGAARQYYDANPQRFEQPARLRAEYVVFDQDGVRRQVKVSDDEVRRFYDGNPARFGRPEERQVRHILIAAAADAPAEEVAKAGEKAAAILAQLRADPKRFAELAKAESQDPGSAASGGELGFFGRGAMVKPFEDAAFALTKGQISDVVRTDFGFHVIELLDVKPGQTRPFEEVREEIADELRGQAASRLFAERAEQFSNLVYEQADSLQAAADALQLEVHRTDWIERGGKLGDIANEKLIAALFADESVTNRRNVEAVEVAPGKLVSARVVDFEAGKRLPFDEVRASIEQQLRNEEAAKLARARGEAVLAALAKGETAAGEWSAPRAVQRGNARLPAAALDAIFGASSAKLPAHAGVVLPDGGYSIFRIEGVAQPQLTKGDPREQAVSEQYRRLVAERDFAAFLAALRERYEVKVNDAAVRAQPQS